MKFSLDLPLFFLIKDFGASFSKFCLIFLLQFFYLSSLSANQVDLLKEKNVNICFGIKREVPWVGSRSLAYWFDCLNKDTQQISTLQSIAHIPIHWKKSAHTVLFEKMANEIKSEGFFIDAYQKDTFGSVIITDHPGEFVDYCIREVYHSEDFTKGSGFAVTLSCINTGTRQFTGVKSEEDFENQFAHGSFEKFTFFEEYPFYENSWKRIEIPRLTVYAFRK